MQRRSRKVPDERTRDQDDEHHSNEHRNRKRRVIEMNNETRQSGSSCIRIGVGAASEDGETSNRDSRLQDQGGGDTSPSTPVPESSNHSDHNGGESSMLSRYVPRPRYSSSRPRLTGVQYRRRVLEIVRRMLTPLPGSESGEELSSDHNREANHTSQDAVPVPIEPDNYRIWNSILTAPVEGRRRMLIFQRLRRRGIFNLLDSMIDGMDVDGMSYAELLRMQEIRIGNACSGLSREAIARSFKKWESEKTTGPCCICMEEYVAGKDAGELNCGHDFHAYCIEQWLLLNGTCPICRRQASNT